MFATTQQNTPKSRPASFYREIFFISTGDNIDPAFAVDGMMSARDEPLSIRGGGCFLDKLFETFRGASVGLDAWFLSTGFLGFADACCSLTRCFCPFAQDVRLRKRLAVEEAIEERLLCARTFGVAGASALVQLQRASLSCSVGELGMGSVLVSISVVLVL